MNFYRICPSCGYKLLKAENGSKIEIYCPKCREKIMIEIKNDEVSIAKITKDKVQSDSNNT